MNIFLYLPIHFIMKKSIITKNIWVAVFSIAMAYLESAVVVYMRAMFYPDGFNFPLKIIEQNIAITEFFREIATVIMLVGAGIMAGRRAVEKFAFFVFAFAIWDIFYYVFLKLLLNWPDTFFTWDILFMVPITWVGPVLAPLINCVIMLALAVAIFIIEGKRQNTHLGFAEWSLLIGGTLIIIFSYTAEYSMFILSKFSLRELINFTDSYEIMRYATKYIPEYFNWFVFGAGCLLHLLAITIYCMKNSSVK